MQLGQRCQLPSIMSAGTQTAAKITLRARRLEDKQPITMTSKSESFACFMILITINKHGGWLLALLLVSKRRGGRLSLLTFVTHKSTDCIIVKLLPKLRLVIPQALRMKPALTCVLRSPTIALTVYCPRQQSCGQQTAMASQ